jgi:predicted amidohydrolase
MTVAVVQTDPVFGAKEKNLDAAVRAMTRTRADMYVLPELCMSGYNFVSPNEAATQADAFGVGAAFDTMRRFTAEHRCIVVFGFAENDNGTLYNSSALIGFDGATALYRKIHLFDREKLIFAPGNLEFSVTGTAFGAIGMMICFDWYFPESARTLALKGAQIIAHPSNLVLPNCPNAMPVRSLENRVFAATANRIGTEDRGGVSLTFIGQSQVTSPRGEILCRCSGVEMAVAAVEIDPALANNKFATERNHLLRDRRPEFYA